MTIEEITNRIKEPEKLIDPEEVKVYEPKEIEETQTIWNQVN